MILATFRGTKVRDRLVERPRKVSIGGVSGSHGQMITRPENITGILLIIPCHAMLCKVAAKRLRGFDSNDEGAPSPTFQPVLEQFFEREIEILATIRHPNVSPGDRAPCYSNARYCNYDQLQHLIIVQFPSRAKQCMRGRQCTAISSHGLRLPRLSTLSAHATRPLTCAL